MPKTAARAYVKINGSLFVSVAGSVNFDTGGVTRTEVETDISPGGFYSERGRGSNLTADFVYAAGTDPEILKSGADLEVAVEYPDVGETWTIPQAWVSGEGSIQEGAISGVEIRGLKATRVVSGV